MNDTRNGRKPTPRGAPRSPVPSDFSVAQKIRDLFHGNPSEEIAVPAGQVLVRDREVYGESAVAFFVKEGELLIQQVCNDVRQGYVTETVAKCLPGDLAYSQGLRSQNDGQPAKVRVVAAVDSVVMPVTREHVRRLGSEGRIVEMIARSLDQVIESRLALREAVELDDAVHRLLLLIREKYGFSGSVRELLKLLWDAYLKRPRLEEAAEEHLRTIADQEAHIRDKDRRVGELLDSVKKLSNRQIARLEAQVKTERAEAANARRGTRELLEASQADMERQTTRSNETFARIQSVFLKVQGFLARKNVDLRELGITDDALSLFASFTSEAATKLGVTVPPEALADAPSLPLPLVGGDEPPESEPDRPTIPIPLVPPEFSPQYWQDPVRMPSRLPSGTGPRAASDAKPETRRYGGGSVRDELARTQRSVTPRITPPARPRSEPPRDPLAQTADWTLPPGQIVATETTDVSETDISIEIEEDALDPGRATVAYDQDQPFSDGDGRKPPSR